MTTEQLHEILDNDEKKLTVAELKQVIYELKQDCFNEMRKTKLASRDYIFYEGEQNAFQIVLDLFAHLEVNQ